jgi:excisionase family DNA binding protein
MGIDGKVLTVDEVSKILRVHPRTVARRCADGKIPGAYKTGDARNSHWRIPQKGLDQYIKRSVEKKD